MVNYLCSELDLFGCLWHIIFTFSITVCILPFSLPVSQLILKIWSLANDTVAFSVLILPFPAIGTAPEFLCVSSNRVELFPPADCLCSCSALARHHCIVLNWTGQALCHLYTLLPFTAPFDRNAYCTIGSDDWLYYSQYIWLHVAVVIGKCSFACWL